MKLKEKIKNWILKLSVSYIIYYSKNSRYIEYANNEYNYAWKNYKKDDMQSYMCKELNDLLSLLATQGDSGFSIEYKLDMFSKLARFKPLSKLKFNDEEFVKGSFDNDILQNKRDSRIFKYPNGSFSFVDDIIKQESYYIGEDNKIITRNGGCWNGPIYVISDNEIYKIKNVRIKDINKFKGEKIYVKTFALEYPKDWWMSFCREKDLASFIEQYNFDKDYSDINKELEFKDGIYKDEILKRIATIQEYIVNG